MMDSQSIPLTTNPKPGGRALPAIAVKPLNVWRLTIGLAVAVMFSPPNAGAHPSGNSNLRGGTDIVQFISNSRMTNPGIDPNARGQVDVTLNRQGNANNQQLDLSLARLDPDTVYLLVAFIGDDTNATSIAEFTTDRRGAFRVSYMQKGQGNPSPQMELPDALNPVCNVRELDIVNSNMETVLQAVLASPDQGRYLVRRSMNNPGFLPAAAGDLLIQADQRSTQFQLKASGLTPGTNYILAINGEAAQTNSADSAGKLTLTGLPPGSPDVLDIQTVALTDGTGTNVVLTTGGLGIPCSTAAQASLNLGAAANFAVLAGSTVANTGLTTVNGDLGLSPGSAVTGFPPGVLNGTQHVADTTAAQAKLDLTTAYNDAAGRTVAPISVAGNLGGMTLAPGLYKSTSSLEISSGNLTLDAQGDANGVFIFQIASTLITTAGRQVILSGGAKAANVFWQVGTSATLERPRSSREPSWPISQSHWPPAQRWTAGH